MASLGWRDIQSRRVLGFAIAIFAAGFRQPADELRALALVLIGIAGNIADPGLSSRVRLIDQSVIAVLLHGDAGPSVR